MLKHIALLLAPFALLSSPNLIQGEDSLHLEEKVPLDVLRYIHESERQRQAKIETIWGGTSNEQQKCAAIQALNSKPYYGKLQIDVPPRIGQMGVLPAGVTAKVFRVIDEFDVLVDLSWFNDRFEADYHRLFWIRGISAAGMQKGSAINLRGVLKVVEKESYSGYGGNDIEVPVLEVMDVSRFVERVFRKQRYDQAVHNRGKLRVDMQIRDAAEAVAASWLNLAQSYFNEGQDEMGQRRLEIIINRYPDTKAAERAKKQYKR